NGYVSTVTNCCCCCCWPASPSSLSSVLQLRFLAAACRAAVLSLANTDSMGSADARSVTDFVAVSSVNSFFAPFGTFGVLRRFLAALVAVRSTRDVVVLLVRLGVMLLLERFLVQLAIVLSSSSSSTPSSSSSSPFLCGSSLSSLLFSSKWCV